MKLLLYILYIFVMLSLWPSHAGDLNEDVNKAYIDFFTKNSHAIETADDFHPLFKAIGNRKFVLLGESTHGTHEYYFWRDHLSRYLISEKGFRFVGVEGDWENIYRLNEYVKHRTGKGKTARSIMKSMARWPQWMWANEEFADFVEWLRNFNKHLPESGRVGLFGLDMQDPDDSMDAVLSWFRKNDKENYREVKKIYNQILKLPENFASYARNVASGQNRLNDEIAVPVRLLREKVAETDAESADKKLWAAKQNAMAVQRAEAQYYAMADHSLNLWNVRASHMHEVFLRISERHGQGKGIAWAHNTHVGDARAADMAARGEVNIGQLLRQSEGEDQVFILGFATHGGTVIAGNQWGGPMRIMEVVPAHPQSIEGLLRESQLKQSLILLESAAENQALFTPVHHRAIGVIYNPPHEAYVRTILPLRYDAIMYIDQTKALDPIL